MKIAIIGAGFTGLSAAISLLDRGQDVTIYERETVPGGLAAGFQEPQWQWSLEQHYHHIFTSDTAIIDLAKRVGHPIIFERPISATYYKGMIYQLDSPPSLLRFRLLSIMDRLRVGIILFYLRLTPFWRPLEKITAAQFLKKTMGVRPWQVLWQPLFEGKFGRYAEVVSAAWFWARIKKRSARLGYPKGGFAKLAETVGDYVTRHGGTINYGVSIKTIEPRGKSVFLQFNNGRKKQFDKVICTLPTPLFTAMAKKLPSRYIRQISSLRGLGAVNVILFLKNPFLPHGEYWLNINDTSIPFLCIVEHTNFMDKKRYANSHIMYIGNYLPREHDFFGFTQNQLLDHFLPYLKKINPSFTRRWIKQIYAFKAGFAQPIFPLDYSKHIPSFTTPLKNVYLANMQQVYPWDRGTNYAVELGQKVVRIILD